MFTHLNLSQRRTEPGKLTNGVSLALRVKTTDVLELQCRLNTGLVQPNDVRSVLVDVYYS